MVVSTVVLPKKSIRSHFGSDIAESEWFPINLRDFKMIIENERYNILVLEHLPQEKFLCCNSLISVMQTTEERDGPLNNELDGRSDNVEVLHQCS